MDIHSDDFHLCLVPLCSRTKKRRSEIMSQMYSELSPEIQAVFPPMHQVFKFLQATSNDTTATVAADTVGTFISGGSQQPSPFDLFTDALRSLVFNDLSEELQAMFQCVQKVYQHINEISEESSSNAGFGAWFLEWFMAGRGQSGDPYPVASFTGSLTSILET